MNGIQAAKVGDTLNKGLLAAEREAATGFDRLCGALGAAAGMSGGVAATSAAAVPIGAAHPAVGAFVASHGLAPAMGSGGAVGAVGGMRFAKAVRRLARLIS
jgi:hypothetical protein